MIRTLVSPGNPSQVTTACQVACNASSVLSNLTSILLASGIPAEVLTETINTLAEVIRGDQANQVHNNPPTTNNNNIMTNYTHTVWRIFL